MRGNFDGYEEVNNQSIGTYLRGKLELIGFFTYFQRGASFFEGF